MTLTPEQKVISEQKIIQEVLKHMRPSPDTIRFMQETQKTMVEFDKKFDKHIVEHENATKEINDLKNEILDLKKIFNPLEKGNIYEHISGSYVSKESFWPVKTIVYGLVAIILTGVVVAVISLVVK